MKYLYTILLAILLVACNGTDEPEPEDNGPVDQTVIMFFPWSTNLKSYFIQNINDFADAATEDGLENKRVIVCIESSPGEADIIKLKMKKGACVRDTLSHYSNPEFTTVSGLTQMFNKVTAISPSERYGLIIGCHGMGWLPVQKDSSRDNKPGNRELMHYEYENSLTRYFGGTTSQYQIEIGDLAQSISDAGLKMEYILFDDCYMSSVEAAYVLRNVTHYLIACPTEIMNYGFPYHKCGKYLLNTPDYEKICDEFYDFYMSYTYPYGTIAVTDCTELEALAETVRDINRTQIYGINTSQIQTMDGYTPTIFFDLEDIMVHKTNNEDQLNNFKSQLAKAVPYKRHTPTYYANAKPNENLVINTYSGITTSDSSTNTKAKTWSQTAWYQATH